MASAKEYNCVCTVQYRRRDNKVPVSYFADIFIILMKKQIKTICTLEQLEKQPQHGETYTTGHREALPTSNISLDFI